MTAAGQSGAAFVIRWAPRLALNRPAPPCKIQSAPAKNNPTCHLSCNCLSVRTRPSKSAICHYPVLLRNIERIRMKYPSWRPRTSPAGIPDAASDTDSQTFQPVRISDNRCWQNAFIQFNICHRIDANELATLRHDVGLYQFRLNIWPGRLSYQTSCGQSRKPLP